MTEEYTIEWRSHEITGGEPGCHTWTRKVTCETLAGAEDELSCIAKTCQRGDLLLVQNHLSLRPYEMYYVVDSKGKPWPMESSVLSFEGSCFGKNMPKFVGDLLILGYERLPLLARYAMEEIYEYIWFFIVRATDDVDTILKIMEYYDYAIESAQYDPDEPSEASLLAMMRPSQDAFAQTNAAIVSMGDRVRTLEYVSEVVDLYAEKSRRKNTDGAEERLASYNKAILSGLWNTIPSSEVKVELFRHIHRIVMRYLPANLDALSFHERIDLSDISGFQWYGCITPILDSDFRRLVQDRVQGISSKDDRLVRSYWKEVCAR